MSKITNGKTHIAESGPNTANRRLNTAPLRLNGAEAERAGWIGGTVLAAAVMILGLMSGAWGIAAEEEPKAKQRGWSGLPGISVDENGDMVRIGGDACVNEGETRKNVVVMGGNAVVRGHVNEEVVVMGGNLTLSGSVDGNVVAIGGTASIAPTARIGGELTTIGATASIDSAASILGSHVNVVPWIGSAFTRLKEYAGHCLFKGRFFAPSLGWTMWALAGLLALCIFLALLFAKPFARSVDIVEQKPVMALLVGLLVPVALGPVIVVLLATVVGIAAIPVLLGVLMWAKFIGGAAVMAFVGRQLVRGFSRNTHVAPGPAAVVGAALFGAVACVPVAGCVVTLFVFTFGTGAVVYALIDMTHSSSRNAKRHDKPVDMAQPVQPAPLPPEVQPATTPPAPAAALPAAAQTAPPLESPAGFWHRCGAAVIDILLVGVVYAITFGPLVHVGAFLGHAAGHPPFHADPGGPIKLLLLLVYLAVMWSWKQTTVGGIIFRLKIRRIDGVALAHGVAVVRALGLLLSVLPLGLGFLWIAWDDKRQGWHDKIAGTMVYRVSGKGSLV